MDITFVIMHKVIFFFSSIKCPICEAILISIWLFHVVIRIHIIHAKPQNNGKFRCRY